MRLVVLAVVAVAAMRVAGASPESDKLFGNGKDLLKAGKLAEACEAFAHSQKLAPRVGTLLNLADCRERQGQTATAWSLFREAKALASETKDKREAEATRRAAALESRLAYLTLKVAPVEGLVIKRNGTVVDPAAWNQAVPLDPGDYAIEGSAPRYKPWSAKQPLAARERVSVGIELVAEPAAVAVVPVVPKRDPKERPLDVPLVPGPGDGITLPALPRKGPVPQLRSAAVGLALGVRDGADLLIAGRLLGSVAVPGGALRGIGSVLYTNTQIYRLGEGGPGSEYSTNVFAFGLSVDYVWAPVPRFAFAGGIGIGLDYLVSKGPTDEVPSETNQWTTLRASPIIVRLQKGHVELGLHVQLVRTTDGIVFLGAAAIDVFPL